MDTGKLTTEATFANPSTTEPPNIDKTSTSLGVSGALLFLAVILVIIILRKKCSNREEYNTDSIRPSSYRRSGVEEGEEGFNMWGEQDEGCEMTVDISEDVYDLMKTCYIDGGRLILGKVLGKGQFGLVYEASLSRQARASNDYGPLTHTKVAVKTLKGSTTDSETVEAFITEGMIMKDFNHKNVLTLIGVTLGDHGVPMIILPFMKYGSLKKYISKSNRTLTVRDLLSFALQVAEGMQYLVTQKFVHRDLACRNCMLDENLVIKVADFGLSRDIYTKEYYSSEDKQAKLPVKWMALESLVEGKYTTKSDVWSYGVLLWELLTRGSAPYPDVANWEVRGYIQNGRRMEPPPSCPPAVGELMLDCWIADPKSRPAFDEIIERLNKILRPASVVSEEGEYYEEEDHEYFNTYINVNPEEEIEDNIR